MCPIGAMRLWMRVFGEGPETALCAPQGVRQVTRATLEGWLKAAAHATGVPVERINTHSLRVGGATALYNAGWELQAIQRFGRWSGGLAFHGYLWETAELSRGAAAAMTRHSGQLHAGLFMPGAAGADRRVDPRRASSGWARVAQEWGPGV